MERTEARWPIGNGERGIIARHQPASNQQNERRADDKNRKSVVPAIIGICCGNQTKVSRENADFITRSGAFSDHLSAFSQKPHRWLMICS
jgi:hypothetical protein